MVEFTVGVDGRATDIKVVKEDPKGFGFDEAAVEAVKKCALYSSQEGWKSVPMRVRQTIRFNLDD